jgi:hypothetical protein
MRYLFVAELTDGTFFKQTPEDKSLTDPKRNCYYDLLQLLEKENKTIRRFSLVGEGNIITVDLGNGLFYVNGLALLLESDKLPTLPARFDLIWYHQVTQSVNVTVNNKSKNIVAMNNKSEFREYFIGWRCNINGRVYQQKIAVS